jgi:hypothetical protein
MKLVKYPVGEGRWVWFWLDSFDKICSPNFATEEEAKAWYEKIG